MKAELALELDTSKNAKKGGGCVEKRKQKVKKIKT
jgi:hypothetical protein